MNSLARETQADLKQLGCCKGALVREVGPGSGGEGSFIKSIP